MVDKHVFYMVASEKNRVKNNTCCLIEVLSIHDNRMLKKKMQPNHQKDPKEGLDYRQNLQRK